MGQAGNGKKTKNSGEGVMKLSGFAGEEEGEKGERDKRNRKDKDCVY